jgi:hypothetical protein
MEKFIFICSFQSVSQYIEQMEVEDNPEEMIEEPYKRKNNQVSFLVISKF